MWCPCGVGTQRRRQRLARVTNTHHSRAWNGLGSSASHGARLALRSRATDAGCSTAPQSLARLASSSSTTTSSSSSSPARRRRRTDDGGRGAAAAAADRPASSSSPLDDGSTAGEDTCGGAALDHLPRAGGSSRGRSGILWAWSANEWQRAFAASARARARKLRATTEMEERLPPARRHRFRALPRCAATARRDSCVLYGGRQRGSSHRAPLQGTSQKRAFI